MKKSASWAVIHAEGKPMQAEALDSLSRPVDGPRVKRSRSSSVLTTKLGSSGSIGSSVCSHSCDPPLLRTMHSCSYSSLASASTARDLADMLSSPSTSRPASPPVSSVPAYEVDARIHTSMPTAIYVDRLFTLGGPAHATASLSVHTNSTSGAFAPVAALPLSSPQNSPLAASRPSSRYSLSTNGREFNETNAAPSLLPSFLSSSRRSCGLADGGYRRCVSALPDFIPPIRPDGSDSDSDDDGTEETTRAIVRGSMLRRTGTSLLDSSWRTCHATAPRVRSGSGLVSPPSPLASAASMPQQGSQDVGALLGQGKLPRVRSSYHLTNSQAAVELFLRLNHARQTVDYVKRQTAVFARLDKAELTVQEALGLLSTLREYEAALMGSDDCSPDLPLVDHAYQTAELCRAEFPQLEWLHLAGLLHSLGKLLAHARFGSQPQWAVCGESYPVGCRASPEVVGSQYFSANPDRRRRLYNGSTLGCYSPGCGLSNVIMSWSGAEYLHLVLLLNRAQLPAEAMFLLRYHKFPTLTLTTSGPGAGGHYAPLLSRADVAMLPLLARFQELCTYREVPLPATALKGAALHGYYDGLIKKYIGAAKLMW